MRNSHQNLVALFILIACFAGCRTNEVNVSQNKYHNGGDSFCAKSANDVELRDPAADASEAFDRHQFCLLAVEGLGITIPGIPPRRIDEYIDSFSIISIENTSDRDELAKTYAVEEYASIYNMILLRKLRFGGFLDEHGLLKKGRD